VEQQAEPQEPIANTTPSLKATNLMSQSLVKILVHIVFSTKKRAEIITPDIEPQFYAYIRGIIENNGAKMLVAGGMSDHSHFLVSLGRNDVGALVGDVKRDSSSWIKKQDPRFSNFYWQRGYGAFSVGESQVAAVRNYILNQKEHHKRQTFQDEFRELCRRYGVDLDERYVWD
jgi:REP element-mobilizing transposase RayT